MLSAAPMGHDGGSGTTTPELLARIARALDRPVTCFDDHAEMARVRQDSDMLRLWHAIRTDAGRLRALDALRAVARDEASTPPPETARRAWGSPAAAAAALWTAAQAEAAGRLRAGTGSVRGVLPWRARVARRVPGLR